MSRHLGAREVARMLAARAPELARELLPGGRREGQEWRVGSLSGEKGQSLAVHLGGERAGVWCDFSSGEAGDGLDLVAATLFRGDKGAALRWARRWLGLSDSGPAAPTPPRPEPRPQNRDADAERRRRVALALFLEAEPRLVGSPVDSYLRNRAIDLSALGRQPAALRFHPACWCHEAGRSLPAMVAAITEPGGRHLASHRTYLEQDQHGQWVKARLKNPKMVLGSFAGGVIPLQRGASGRPLRQAPDGEEVALGEGVENSLTAALAAPELRILAGISVANLARINLPPAIRRVLLLADNDPPGSPAALALQKAVDRFLAEGRQVRIARPPQGFKDLNDLAQSEETEAA